MSGNVLEWCVFVGVTSDAGIVGLIVGCSVLIVTLTIVVCFGVGEVIVSLYVFLFCFFYVSLLSVFTVSLFICLFLRPSSVIIVFCLAVSVL